MGTSRLQEAYIDSRQTADVRVYNEFLENDGRESHRFQSLSARLSGERRVPNEPDSRSVGHGTGGRTQILVVFHRQVC